MMKVQTINKLNTTADIIADMLIVGAKSGMLRRSECDDKEKSEYNRIKKTICMGKKAFMINDLINICKTTRQLNFLSNEVLYRLRRQKFFAMVKTAPKVKYVQQTLPLFN